MSINIVLPDGDAPKTGRGTKIFTDEGHEIKGVTGCNIEIMPNGAIRARLDVFVKDIENLENIEAAVTITNPEDERVSAFWPAIDSPPSEGTWILYEGERVLSCPKQESVESFIDDIISGAKK